MGVLWPKEPDVQHLLAVASKLGGGRTQARIGVNGRLVLQGHSRSRDSGYLFLQLQGMCLVEQQVVVSSDTEEEASGSDQGTVGQLLPRA